MTQDPYQRNQFIADTAGLACPSQYISIPPPFSAPGFTSNASAHPISFYYACPLTSKVFFFTTYKMHFFGTLFCISLLAPVGFSGSAGLLTGGCF